MRFVYLFLLVCSANFLFAQTNNTSRDSIRSAESSEQFSLKSPYHTIHSHLFFLQPENFKPEIAGQVFDLNDKKKAADLAIKLKQILDGEGLFVDMKVLPRNNNYLDSTSGIHRYIPFQAFPEIYVEKKGKNWFYSDRTTSSIESMHNKIFPLGTDFLMNLFPEYGHQRYLGLELWQFVGVFLLLLLGFVSHKIFTILLDLTIRVIIKKYSKVRGEAIDVIHEISKPFSLFLVFLLVYFFEPALQIPVHINKYIMMLLRIVPPVFAVVTAYRCVDLVNIYMVSLADKTENTLDDQLVPMVRKTLKVLVVIIGVLVILQNLNFNITALLAGISIGGLAFALAAQDTIKNLFGSLMIFVDKPFQVGDWINFSGVDGTVEEVGFRSTRVRTFANSLVSVPNGRIADMTIDNFGLRRYRRFSTNIALTYDTPPDLIEAYVKGLRELIAQHPKTRKDYYEVQLNNMGAHSLDILFYAFFEVPTWSEEIEAKHELLISIIKLAEVVGVRFAFPTQTLHIEDFPEKKGLTPVYKESRSELDAKVAAFLKENQMLRKGN